MRYLTKSKFQLACDCPAKLFYIGKLEYANQKLDDSFLMALADGGFQVGELAKHYFHGGYNITSLNYKNAINQTNELIKQKNVTIYEAAICFDNLFIRADILVKKNNQLQLIEVKAKSFDASSEEPFINRKGTIKSEWKPYLYDVAFQKYVLNQAFPDYNIQAYLMMADKTAECPTDGLNQKFRIVKDKRGRRSVSSNNLTQEDLSSPILCKVKVNSLCDQIYQETTGINNKPLSFIEKINLFSDYYTTDKKILKPVSKKCAKCEFYITKIDNFKGFKSGKQECWSENFGWTNKDFECLTVFDIWNFRKKDKLIDQGKIKITEITEDDISPKPRKDKKTGLSHSERQWLQVQKYQVNDLSFWIDKENLSNEMNSWKYPLHFIDFETTQAAIPFNKGRRPYEGIAFQFSHHVVYEDGRIEHFGQYLNTQKGVFPNYDFLRNLKNELSNDSGTIFRYSNHENSFLTTIYWQLMSDRNTIPYKIDLCDFIKTITHSVNNNAEQWTGERNMVDMCEIVKRYYYDPATNGSNSIKKILPAILNSSDFLKEKYSQPIYGTPDGIKSFNFKDWKWIKFDNDGIVIDPYKLLPKMFQDISEQELCKLSNDNELKDGGAALTAYARIQFEEMSEYERKEIEKALLKYCELDTIAMVMIYEGWKEMVTS